MNTSAPTLSPLFRSDVQGEILARLFLAPEGQRLTTSELSRFVGSSYATTHREVQRLIDAGLLIQRRNGRNKYVEPDRGTAAFKPLVELLTISYGPAVIVPRVLTNVRGVHAAYLYGSWADRRSGNAGSAPGDIDVIVVGNPSRAALAEAATSAEKVLGREVNIRIASDTAWSSGDDLFVRTIQALPLINLEIYSA